MKFHKRYRIVAECVVLLVLAAITAQAETFTIQIGDTVSDGVPGPGAGRIAVSTATDVYSFSGTADQLVFCEEISVDNAFAGHLYWELKSPTGKRVFGKYFGGSNPGRQVLPETGTYTFTFSVSGAGSSYIGTYSFRLRPIPPDTTFAIQIGDIISDGVPAPGAGRIEVPGAQDQYTLAGTAGQLVFCEEISIDKALSGYLYWELKSPTGKRVFGNYFDASNPGRQTLPETGIYTLTFYVNNTGASFIGAYSFRLRLIPPDTTFAIQIGDTVSDGVPAPGAGRIEVPGAKDQYTFAGTAGQLVFCEEISVDKSLSGYLYWELNSPTGKRVFGNYFDGSNPERQTLPENGTYTLTFYVNNTGASFIGAYSFRPRLIPPDTTFPIQIGDTISDGVPAPGAGRIEVPGAQDLYTFNGTAGQLVFCEEISVDKSLSGYLYWELNSPTGKRVFGNYFDGSNPERQTLPETGIYTLTFYVNSTTTNHLGAYSFRLRPSSQDTILAIQIGDKIADGLPATGAGRIETPGAKDIYGFQGTAGQNVIFEEINVSNAFTGHLYWELKSPTDQRVFGSYFSGDKSERRTLPESGNYTLTVYAIGTSVSYVGTYSFRLFSPVVARPDSLATQLDHPLVVPIGKFLCNDLSEPNDVLEVDLPLTTTVQGGILAKTATAVVYTPKPGFSGTDTFPYTLRGRFGGTDTALVTVQVVVGIDPGLVVVSVFRMSPRTVRACLLGAPSQTYQVVESTDLKTWFPKETLTTEADGSANYDFTADLTGSRFYGFRKP
jgi:hypothetical protein